MSRAILKVLYLYKSIHSNAPLTAGIFLTWMFFGTNRLHMYDLYAPINNFERTCLNELSYSKYSIILLQR